MAWHGDCHLLRALEARQVSSVILDGGRKKVDIFSATFVLFFLFLETGFCCVVQVGLKLTL